MESWQGIKQVGKRRYILAVDKTRAIAPAF